MYKSLKLTKTKTEDQHFKSRFFREKKNCLKIGKGIQAQTNCRDLNIKDFHTSILYCYS